MAKRKDPNAPRPREQQDDQVVEAALRGAAVGDSGDRGGRGVSASVAAGVIGMGLAAQSASEGGMAAFASPVLSGDSARDSEAPISDSGAMSQSHDEAGQGGASEGPTAEFDIASNVVATANAPDLLSEDGDGDPAVSSSGAAYLFRDADPVHRVESAEPLADTSENLAEAKLEAGVLTERSSQVNTQIRPEQSGRDEPVEAIEEVASEDDAVSDVVDVVPEVVDTVTEVVDDVVDVVTDLTDGLLGEDGAVSDVVDVVPEVVDTVTEVVDDVVDVVTDLTDGLLGENGAVSDVVDVVPEVVDTVTEVVDTLAETVGGLTDTVGSSVDVVGDVVDELGGLVSGLFGGGDGAADDTVETVSDVAEGATDAVGDLTGAVIDIAGGLLRFAKGSDSSGQPIASAADQAALGEIAGSAAPANQESEEQADAGESPTSEDSLGSSQETALEDSVEVAVNLGDASAEDDGFLDTLLGADGVDALLGPVIDPVFEGLLGGEDTFGVDVAPQLESLGDDISAGLSDVSSLTGSLANSALFEPTELGGGPEDDVETDSLLNEILAGGVDDILGIESEFENLLSDDSEPDEAVVEGTVDAAVEGALDVLFSPAEGTLLDDLFGGSDSDDAV